MAISVIGPAKEANLPFSVIPLLLLTIPLLEIAAFIVIGGKIGVLATLAMVFATAVIGSILLRIQGFGLINKIRMETEQGRVPGRELVHGVMILIAGILLLTPGFVTDAMGFLLFIPAVRDFGWRLVRDRVVIVARQGMGSGSAHPRPGDPKTIDLDEDEFTSSGNPDSPWR